MRLLSWILLLLLSWDAALAQDASAPTHYLGRRIAKTMSYHGASWLIRREREQEERTSELFKALRVQPGQVVCDLGCGNGYHALPLAEMVGPDGKVLCVDIQPEMLTLLKRRAQEKGVLDRIQPILGTATDPKLKPSSVDLVLMVDVYHEISHPESVLRHVTAALKPGGQVVFVEFRTEDLQVPIKHEHKMSRKQVVREATANGLKLVRAYEDLPWQHVLFFERAKDRSERPPLPTWRETERGPVVPGLEIRSEARLQHGVVDQATDIIFSGRAPEQKHRGPFTLSVTLTGDRVAGLPLRLFARARGRDGDPGMWVSSPPVGPGSRSVHGGSDRSDRDRSLVTWTLPVVRTETEGEGGVLVFERNTRSEDLQVTQHDGGLTVTGVQRSWRPGRRYAFRFGIMPVKAASDAAAEALYETWSHEQVGRR